MNEEDYWSKREHMVLCVEFNLMCYVTYWFNPNVSPPVKHYRKDI